MAPRGSDAHASPQKLARHSVVRARVLPEKDLLLSEFGARNEVMFCQ